MLTVFAYQPQFLSKSCNEVSSSPDRAKEEALSFCRAKQEGSEAAFDPLY